MASRASKYLAAAVAAAAVTGAVEANFVGFAVTSASVTNSGVQLTVYNVFAVFDGPTDTSSGVSSAYSSMRSSTKSRRFSARSGCR